LHGFERTSTQPMASKPVWRGSSFSKEHRRFK
jgi:hypothetical protein